jgi:hypothetical protein
MPFIKKTFTSSIFTSPILPTTYQTLPYKPFSTRQILNMPLVVPGINSNDVASKTEEWANKLVGKKIGDGASDATVWYGSRIREEHLLNLYRPLPEQTFPRKPESLNQARWLLRISSQRGNSRSL